MRREDDDTRAATLAADHVLTRDDSVAPPGAATAAEATPPSTIGRYQLVARLGAGAMGVVWSATDPQLERKVAIKLVHPRLASAPEASLRMLREARLMAKLSHRAVVTVHDAGEVDGVLFLAMELIDGETLTARLRRPEHARPEHWRQRLALVIEAGRGLAAAHTAGVLHRDFKPDNVLVDGAGRVCVGDFGLATLGDVGRDRPGPTGAAGSGGAADLTTTGALLGTPVYMSPQQLRGEPIDAHADQFAFCVAAHEALYGARPFGVAPAGLATIPLLIEAIEAGTLLPAPPATLVPSAVRDVLRRGLAAAPDARWPDMQALLAALEVASGLRARRRRGFAIATAAVAVVAIAAGAGAYLYARGEPPAPIQQPSIRTLFEVPLQARIALGPGGTTIAVAGDHIDVHEPGRDLPWRLALPSETSFVQAIELDADEVRFSTQDAGGVAHWRFREPAVPVLQPSSDHRWLAQLSDGELDVVGAPRAVPRLAFVRGGREVATWPVTWPDVDVFAPSPDHRRFAFLEPGAASSEIHVIAADGSLLRSPQIRQLTALAWLDAETLLFARGTQDRPSISALPVSATGFGTPRELYHEDIGWFTRLASRDGHIVFVDGRPTSRVRVIVHRPGDMSERDREPSRVAAEIGWSTAGELLVWNRITHRVETVRGRASGVETKLRLPAEPANATAAGDVRIVTVRAALGREVIALDATTGDVRWRVPDGQLEAVRCVLDRQPPCVAIQPVAGADEIVDLDPATGAVGALRVRLNHVEDIALRADGHMLVVGSGNGVRELDATGAVVATLPTELENIRSVAYAADGSFLVAGTAGPGTYELDRFVDGAHTVLVSSDNEVLLLARPSPDGTELAIVARRYAPVLQELVVP